MVCIMLTGVWNCRIRFFYEEADLKNSVSSVTTSKHAMSPYELPIPFKE